MCTSSTRAPRLQPPRPLGVGDASKIQTDAKIVDVLTNPELFDHITSFIDGLPRVVHEYKLPDGVSAPPVQDWYQSADRVIAAVVLADRAMLLRLYRLFTGTRVGDKSRAMLEFHGAAVFAVLTGNSALFQWMHVHMPRVVAKITTQQYLEVAVSVGDPAMTKLIREESPLFVYPVNTLRIIEAIQAAPSSSAAEYSTRVRDTIAYVHEQRLILPNYFDKILLEAVWAGCGGVVEYFLSKSIAKVKCHSLYFAAIHGHLDVAVAIVKHTSEGCLVEARRRAETNGNDHVARMLKLWTVSESFDCCQRKHGSGHASRRCQRKAKDLFL